MSVWTDIGDWLASHPAVRTVREMLDQLRAPPERSVAFTIATLALGAKLAKADGQVTRGEVATFRRVFVIPKAEEANAARVFDLARQDTAGFETYAAQVRDLFGRGAEPLVDLIEGLFHVALADGDYAPSENTYLARVAEIFGLSERDFARIRAEFVPTAARDPWDVLGLPHDATVAEARAAWRALVRGCHPDQVRARGLPEEAVQLAEARLVALNAAMDAIEQGRPHMAPA